MSRTIVVKRSRLPSGRRSSATHCLSRWSWMSTLDTRNPLPCAALDSATDPATVNCTVNPDTARTFKLADFLVFNDEAADADNPGRRSYECAQIVGPGETGDVVPTGSFQLQRAYAGVPAGQATFGTLRCAHLKGRRVQIFRELWGGCTSTGDSNRNATHTRRPLRLDVGVSAPE